MRDDDSLHPFEVRRVGGVTYIAQVIGRKDDRHFGGFVAKLTLGIHVGNRVG